MVNGITKPIFNWVRHHLVGAQDPFPHELESDLSTSADGSPSRASALPSPGGAQKGCCCSDWVVGCLKQ